MSNTISLGIIGLGNMGGGLCQIWQQFPELFEVRGFDTNPEKCKKYFGNTRHTLEEVLNAQYVILAIKPQSFQMFAKSLKNISDETIFLSIMGGVSIETIQNTLSSKKVIRLMPNLPVIHGLGSTGCFLPQDIDWGASVRIDIEHIISKTGSFYCMEAEDQLDMFTTIAGCGPAYFFFLTEMLANIALEYGLSESDVQKIARETLIGSAALLSHSDLSPQAWRSAVTSKAGITEKAISILQEQHFEEIFRNALFAALDRARELRS